MQLDRALVQSGTGRLDERPLTGRGDHPIGSTGREAADLRMGVDDLITKNVLNGQPDRPGKIIPANPQPSRRHHHAIVLGPDQFAPWISQSDDPDELFAGSDVLYRTGRALLVRM